jgi:pimeloyl-ACP methyl ester carboxylesterase
MKRGERSARPARRRQAQRAGDDYGRGDRPDWRAIDWPAHMHTARLCGTPVNYVDIGERDGVRPLVFVHGLSGQWQNWLENIPRFARQRRVVALDLPGFGRSPLPSEQITIAYYGRIVEELCRELDLAPAVLVGNSMGGYVAAEVEIAFPATAERLVLVSAAGISQRHAPRERILRAARIMSATTRSSLAQRRQLAVRPATRHFALSMVVRHPTRLAPDLALEGLMKGAQKPGFHDALLACLDYDFVERLPEIGCPTLVVWGEDDMVIPVRDADTFVELIPGSRKLVMRDTGHVPMVERAATFNDELERFLAHDVAPGELEDRGAPTRA